MNKKHQEKELNMALYSDSLYVAEKWRRIFGRLSRYADHNSYETVIKEAFNLTDKVMENVIMNFRQEYWDSGEEVTFTNSFGDTVKGIKYSFLDEPIDYKTMKTFYGKTDILKTIGYPIPDNIDEVRKIRNATTHSTDTVVGAVWQDVMTYENVLHSMEILGRLLAGLDFIKEEDIHPPFERLRVQPGDKIGPTSEYEIESLIAEGGMSRVYLARHDRLERMVAIKELKPYAYMPEQIQSEKEFLVRMDSVYIPKIYDIFEQNGTHYIVMQLIEGSTLDKYINNFSIDTDEKLAILLNAARALQYIHNDCNMIYADMKPGNMMISEEGRLFLIDFGISRMQSAKTGADAFTRMYSSPEQMEGGLIDKRTDIYSYGRVMEFLFRNELQGPEVPRMKGIISDIKDVIDKCTEKEPTDRFQKIEEVEEVLWSIRNDISKGGKNSDRLRNALIGAGAFIAAVVILIFAYINLFYPKGVISEGRFPYESTAVITDEGILIDISLINRCDTSYSGSTGYIKTKLEIKNMPYDLTVPCKLDKVMKPGDITLHQKYLVRFETLGFEKADVDSVGKPYFVDLE